ncbi:hypothetical protein ABGB18_29235 [Nonomuraea sp. B12E4]|uniref:hypothetical protein n=1 Tax=Nonomuraea sp. B12E4 TaxID=3153564 RepID=UPI00325EF103
MEPGDIIGADRVDDRVGVIRKAAGSGREDVIRTASNRPAAAELSRSYCPPCRFDDQRPAADRPGGQSGQDAGGVRVVLLDLGVLEAHTLRRGEVGPERPRQRYEIETKRPAANVRRV